MHNRRHARDLADVRVDWVREVAGEAVAQGTLEVQAAANEHARVPLPEQALADGGADTFLTVTATSTVDEPWAEAGHVLGRCQVRIDEPARPVALPAPTAAPGTTASGLRVGSASLDRDGRLRALDELPVTASHAELWRAPTENDRIPWGASYEVGDPWLTDGHGASAPPSATRWRAAGLDRLLTRTVSSRVVGDRVEVAQRLLPAQGVAGAVVHWSWQADGDGALVSFRVAPVRPGTDTTWPRIGWHLALPLGYETLRWFGSGPDEAYADTGNGNVVGVFERGVDELSTRYAVPQETGHRTGMRWARLSGPGLPTLVLQTVGADLPGITVARHDAHELTAAAHQFQLPTPSATHLYLDARQHGIGSRACGPDVLPRHQLWPSMAGFSVRIGLE